MNKQQKENLRDACFYAWLYWIDKRKTKTDQEAKDTCQRIAYRFDKTKEELFPFPKVD